MRHPWLVLAIGSLLLSGCANGLNLYVATNGNDGWSGRLPTPGAGNSGPFATLERARDEIRTLKEAKKLPTGPITVHIRGGVHPLDRTFELTAADGGSEKAPVTYRAYQNEEVRISGGREVTGWVPVKDPAVLKRLEPAARDHVLRADLTALGITGLGTVEPGGNKLELFFADRPMTLARWPNEDYAKIAGVSGEKPIESHGHKGDAVGKLTYDGDRPSRWKNETDIWLSGYWFWDWADAYQKVESIDTDRKRITLKTPYHHYGYRKGQRYVALNLLSELDMPGEWYLDRAGGIVYFWPPADITSSKVYVSVLGNLIAVKDTSHVTLRGLTLKFNRATAVTIAAGDHVTVAGCTLRSISGQAARIEGGTDHSFVGCDLYDLGDGGISVLGGDRMKLTPGRHAVLNCHFYRYSRNSTTYRPAVSLNGFGNRVAHCSIHDAPHMAIQFTGNEHVMEFNEIYRVCTETDDAGAIYTGRDWTWRGNVIRHNYFHDMGTYKTWVGVQSVYLDDMASATTVYGNIIVRGGRGVLLGGGRNNTVENNIFVDCTPAVHVDERGTGWAKSFLDDQNNTMLQSLRKTPYKEPPWSTRYPELVNILDDEPGKAKYNVIARNICVGGRWLDLHDKLDDKVVRIENNLVNEDPLFVDAARGDYRLKPESPAFKLGFKPIPVDRIGLYQDALRVSWPPTSQPE
ncbi:MAG TPA: right-handed parallel beta-helix repeat-containing protein [Phycisphaerae bacterium]|nr:right-handed parallel beta-helix repeat-containing protein [Phycisphaerae bacterium]